MTDTEICNAITDLRDSVHTAHVFAQILDLGDETLTQLVNAWIQLDVIRTRLIQERDDEERQIAWCYLDAGRHLLASINCRIDAILFGSTS